MLCTLFPSTLVRVKSKIFLPCLVAASAFGQWNPHKSNTSSSLNGLSIVNANVVWSSGTGGSGKPYVGRENDSNAEPCSYRPVRKGLLRLCLPACSKRSRKLSTVFWFTGWPAGTYTNRG